MCTHHCMIRTLNIVVDCFDSFRVCTSRVPVVPAARGLVSLFRPLLLQGTPLRDRGLSGVSGERDTPLPRTPDPPHIGAQDQEQPAAKILIETSYLINWQTALRSPEKPEPFITLHRGPAQCCRSLSSTSAGTSLIGTECANRATPTKMAASTSLRLSSLRIVQGYPPGRDREVPIFYGPSHTLGSVR